MSLSNVTSFVVRPHCVVRFILPVLFVLTVGYLPVANAATPVVDTTIALSKTGSEPFDAASWTGDGPGGVAGGVNAGQDADENDNIVRLQDSITYRVEVSVNDSEVDDLVSTVTLNQKQKWITIPTGCKTDPDDVGTQPVSSISADGTTLVCNLGPAIEGTTKVFFPAARAVGADPITGDVTRNDDIVTAGVSSQAYSAANGTSAPVTDGPTQVIVTGFFRVDLQKELKSTSTDPITGEPLYEAPTKTGPAPDNRAGSIIEYTVKAVYVKGSLLADGDQDTTAGGSPGVASYRIIDVLTDDNTNNNTATLSTGAQLYTWDPDQPACELLGDHGASATVTCTELAAAIDDIGPGATAPDGLNDLAIQIDLANIDVSDPDNDANLFEVRLNVWFDKANDLDNHQECTSVGVDCINTVTNRVGLWDGSSTTLAAFDEDNDNAPVGNNPGIVSTEDASGNNVGNYNAGQEPFPNQASYPLFTAEPGAYSAHKSFTHISLPLKTPDQTMAAGETRPFLLNVYDYRKIDQAETIMCDKIDTQVFEYAGVAPPNQIGSPPLYGWNQNKPWNPVMSTFFGSNGTTLGDGSALVEFFFTNHPYTADPLTDQAAYIAEMRTATCEDDVNADGNVVIQLADGSLVDENGDPAASTVVDWWVEADDVPPLGGGAGAAANVTRLRQDSIYDAAFAQAQDPTHERFAIAVNHLITAKPIAASPYGSNNRLPNFASYNRQEADGSYLGWRHALVSREDPDADDTFATNEYGTVDRMTLVPSSHSIAKYTDPRGLKVVRGGDNVDFIIEGQVFGIWDDTTSNTATLNDDLPNGTGYVANSEQFSSDGGTSWHTRAEWDARFLAGNEDVEITSAAHAGGDDPLIWAFGSLNSSGGVSDKLPLIKYTVAVDPARVSGTFTNIATIDSGAIGGDVKEARYQLTILPEFGLDVLKTVDSPIYAVNAPFSFDLVYKNLGGEDYSAGEFIDILPYNGDAAGTTGGVSSSRDPQTDMHGVYDISAISSSNGETFYATAATPSTLEEDPCHASNLPAGFDPSVSGGVCELYVQREGSLPGGGTVGTNATGWVACTGLNPLTCGSLDNTDITAIKFSAPTLPAAEGGQTVTIEFEPVGNLGGTPDLDSEGNVTATSTGDIYTNTFSGRIAEISLNVISNDVSVTMVAGSIGDTVWYDLDGDGNGPAGAGDGSDTTEPPIAGSQVALLDDNGDPVYVDPDTGGIVPAGYVNPITNNAAIAYVTTTDANGQYLFENLPVATYSVQVTPPTGAVPTYDADGTGTANVSSHDLQLETDAAGQVTGVEDNQDQDFGYRPPLQVGSTVWLDINNDAEQATDGSEPGIEGVTVQLFPVGADPTTDTPVDSAVTDADGNYILSTDTPGDYFVYIPVPPATATLSSSDIASSGADNQTDGDDNGQQTAAGDPVQSPAISLAFGTEPTDTDEDGLTGSGQDNGPSGVLDANGDMTVDFGFYPTGAIGDLVFVDIDGDGVLDAGDGDAGIGGVTVTLTYTDLDGTPVTLTTTTALDGSYLFDNLPGGVTYTVAVDTSTLPGTFGTDIRQSSDPDAALDNTSTTTLNIVGNEVVDDLDQDFGYVPLGTIGDTIWYDSDKDGVQDAGESGISGVTVQLTPPAGVDLGAGPGMPITTVTDSDGKYLFTELPVGDYQVDVISGVPAAYVQTGDPDSTLDESSNVSLILNPTDPTEVIDNLDQDFGYAEPVSVGGFVWNDLDNDGLQDANEPPIQGSTVTLLMDDGTGNFVPVTSDFDGNPVTPIVVGLDGKYLFDNLFEGDYKLQITKPAGYTPSPVQTTDDNDDTENDSNIATESSTDVYQSGVFTLTRSGEPVEAGTYVGDDQDDSATVATDSSGNMTVDFGFVEPASIGDRVWLDLDNDGVQDANEDGLAGVTVNLYQDTDGDGVISGAELTTPVATVSTGPNGEYLFPELDPGVVYQVGVDTSTVPSDYAQTFDEDDGFGATDSLSGPITLDPGEFHDTADFGYTPPVGSIGDTIWIDANDDGVQDSSELGIADVSVTLTPPSDVDLGNGPGVAITTTTDSNGKYLFSGLPLDEVYIVEVDTTTLPAGYTASSSGLGDPDVRDGNSSTADDQTTVTLTTEEPVNLDADFGYLPPDDQNNTVGDTVWFDDDGDGSQNGSETGAEGVTVNLVDPATGDILATTETDENGNYQFTGVPDGSYDIVVTDANGVLAGTTVTGDPDGGVLGTSSVDLDSSSSSSVPVVNEDQDFGYQPPAPPTSNAGMLGDTVFFDANNSGSPDAGEGIEGVRVELYDSSGVLIGSTTTDANGHYLFTDLPTSAAGETYEVRVDTSTLPNGGTGWSNSVDPDTADPGDSISQWTLTDAAPENLDQDFGYIGADNNSLSGTIWSDTDGNGEQTESGTFEGVTVEVRDQDGNVIQVVETDADGNYEVTNLPDGIYTIVVTDEHNVLSGFEHTDSPNGLTDTSDQTSKDDTGYTVDLDSVGASPTPVTDSTGDFGYQPVVTNPISLGSMLAQDLGNNRVLIRWTTQTEVSNLGFNLYGLVDGDWRALNQGLILSLGDSTQVQSYQLIVQTPARAFAISDVDMTGQETVHEPFLLNQIRGEVRERKQTDWQRNDADRQRKQTEREQQRRQQLEQRNQQRQFQLNRVSGDVSMIKQLLGKAVALGVSVLIPNAHAMSAEDLVNIEASTHGVVELSYQQLFEFGLNIDGVDVTHLAVFNQGTAVPVQVTGSQADSDTFGAGSVIRFISQPVAKNLYTEHNLYTLRLQAGVQVPISLDSRTPIATLPAATSYLATKTYALQQDYLFSSPDTSDPWSAQRVVSVKGRTPETAQVNFDLDDYQVGGNTGSTQAKLNINVWGGTDLAGSEEDHHMIVNFNDQVVIDRRFDGVKSKHYSSALNNVKDGQNKVTVALPLDTGYDYDFVHLNEIEVSYPRKFRAQENRLNFMSSQRKFHVNEMVKSAVSTPSNPSDSLLVYRKGASGHVYQMNKARLQCGNQSYCRAEFAGSGEQDQYYVSLVGQSETITLKTLPVQQDITSGDAAYLIISHPDFIGAQLTALESELANEFGSADVVDVEAIYAQYSHYQFGPQGIQAYIKDAVQNRGTEYILLVGGDVYDYQDVKQLGAISFIPSIYASTGNRINFAPVDAKYVDLDDDNIPDLPIGRLPVRTSDELTALLTKRQAFKNRAYTGKAVFAADNYDDLQQYDFKADAETIKQTYFQGWDVMTAYVDDQGVAGARQRVTDGVNAGQTLTAFFGHSSTNRWSFDGLFSGDDAAGLNNQGKPTVVTQWGCWNTYYVDPREDSMGHRFLMEGDRGAVAVMGASTLTSADAERKLATMVYQRLANGERLGQAITNAKQDYGRDNPQDLDVLLGWTLLGSPELTID